MKKLKLLLLPILTTGILYTAPAQDFVYRFHVGAYEVIMLSDNQGQGNSGILIGATEEIKKQTIPGGTFPNGVNYFIVKTPGKNYLIDGGLGTRMAANLEAIGMVPDDVDTILLTHMHGDHIGGLRKGEHPMFPNAVLKIPAPEFEYWTSDEILAGIPENQRRSFTAARDIVGIYEQNYPVALIQPLTAASNLPDGMHPIAAYGHTPGHTAYLVISKGEKLLIWGDLTHAMAVQMPYPEIAVTYDVDPVTAVKYRLELLKFVTDNKIPVAGMHIAYPGAGAVTKAPSGKGYVFTPYR